MNSAPPGEPTFVSVMLGALIPLAAAIALAGVGGFLIYLFWFGTDWIFHLLASGTFL